MDNLEDKSKTRSGKQFIMRPSQSRLTQKNPPMEGNDFESTLQGEWQLQKKPSSSMRFRFAAISRENLRDAFNNLNIRQPQTQNPSLRGSIFSSQHITRDKHPIQETQNPRPIKNFIYNNSISDSTKLTRTGSTNLSGFKRQQNNVKEKIDDQRKQQLFEEEDKDEEIQFMLLYQTLEKAL